MPAENLPSRPGAFLEKVENDPQFEPIFERSLAQFLELFIGRVFERLHPEEPFDLLSV